MLWQPYFFRAVVLYFEIIVTHLASEIQFIYFFLEKNRRSVVSCITFQAFSSHLNLIKAWAALKKRKRKKKHTMIWLIIAAINIKCLGLFADHATMGTGFDSFQGLK